MYMYNKHKTCTSYTYQQALSIVPAWSEFTCYRLFILKRIVQTSIPICLISSRTSTSAKKSWWYCLLIRKKKNSIICDLICYKFYTYFRNITDSILKCTCWTLVKNLIGHKYILLLFLCFYVFSKCL